MSAGLPRRPRDGPAAVLDGLVRLAAQVHDHVGDIAARHGLTAQQALILRSLDEPRPMRAMAHHLGCDPSNITGLIDRIERLGLVERSPHPADRRVRLLSLTPAGRRVREDIERDLVRGARGLDALTPGEVAQLRELLARLVPDDRGCGGLCG
ncbi:MAG TPA: MarR family transcriptional regulator [Acidimicrobiales bacterium]